MTPEGERIRVLIESYRAGEDPDLSHLCRALWELLYARIPGLTQSRNKDDQHRKLESFLIELGLPKSPDLQYVSGPVLWYARERRVLPPPQNEGHSQEPWVLDPRVYEDALKTLEEGRAAFGDWMANALRDLLAEQQ